MMSVRMSAVAFLTRGFWPWSFQADTHHSVGSRSMTGASALK
jgi:hypothetical protein